MFKGLHPTVGPFKNHSGFSPSNWSPACNTDNILIKGDTPDSPEYAYRNEYNIVHIYINNNDQ